MAETRDPLADRMYRGVGVSIEQQPGWYRLHFDIDGHTYGFQVRSGGRFDIERGWKVCKRSIDGILLRRSTGFRDALKSTGKVDHAEGV